jgi:hypothetical protein
MNDLVNDDQVVARIAQNAFHLHQTSSRWDDLHSADQVAYVDFTRWVLEVLERDSQVIEPIQGSGGITDAEVDSSLILMGFDPCERYPEYGHRHLRDAYREGWKDAQPDAVR